MTTTKPCTVTADADRLPTLTELGRDLLHVSSVRRAMTIGFPFLAMAGYAIFSNMGWWPVAVIAVMALCFITYGSTSHDLVHQTLGLRRSWNQFWLSLIELLSLRSGTAYRLSHLHHHQHLLESSDIEGSAAHMSLIATLICGPTLQIRLWIWAWKNHPHHRKQLLLEATGVFVLACSAGIAMHWTIVPLVYAVLVVAGSWVFPLVTVFIPHNAEGQTPLTQTRLFRGIWARLLAADHLYHLEHHLYPAVPHHNWRTLAVRLDPFFMRMGMCPNSKPAEH